MFKLSPRLCVGKAGGDEADGHAFGIGNVNRFRVEIGSLAARGGKKFVGDGIEDHGDQRHSLFEQRDGNRETGIAVRKICGAIERVHVPFVARSSGCAAGSFFGDDAMVWKFAAQAANDEGFGALVCFSDKIDVTFIGNLLRAAVFGEQHGAGFAGGGDGDIEKLLHRIIAPLRR
jgi:hypothetical protein